MPDDLANLRSEIGGKFEPPVDVMLDPSLLVAETSRKRLADSALFESQTQATLGQTPGQPRVAGLYVPSSFQDLLSAGDSVDQSTTATWNFYRGQAESTTPKDIVELLDTNNVQGFDGTAGTRLSWRAALDESERSDRLTETLEETFAFLSDGGVLLSRTPASLDILRDAGIPTLDIGQTSIEADVRDRLTDIGYRNPAPFCGVGVTSAPAVVTSLVDGLLATPADMLLLRLGR